MTITGVSTAGSITYTPSVSRPQAQPAGDQVSMSLSPDTYSSLVTEASQMPDVRGEVVDAFKARIQSGDYPTSDTLDGLVDRMGGTWAANAQSSSAE
jgi:anti-sigma28 factor (negative regulator of flagellin synthesis)